jgi:hypothetical protein
MRKILAAVIFAVLPGLALSHYYFVRPILNPTSTTTTTTGTATAPVVTTQWRCITAAGSTIPNGGPFATRDAAATPCGVAVSSAAPSATPTHFLEESVVTTTNVPTTTTVRTRRDEVLGGSTLRISDAHAQFLVVSGGGGSSEPDGIYDIPAAFLSQIPWHTAAGAWGAQMVMQTPTPPTTTTSSTVSTAAAMQTALGGGGCGGDGSGAVNGLALTLDTSIASASVVCVWGDDTDIIIPDNIRGPAIETKGGPSRLRIRSTVAGTRCTGCRIGQVRTSDNTTDVILDGVPSNGDTPFSTAETNQCFRFSSSTTTTRVGIYRSSCLSAGYCWLGSSAHTLVIDTNMVCGAETRAQVGYGEGWAIRNQNGPLTILRSRIQTTRYAVIRTQPQSSGGEYLFIAGSEIINTAEGRALWIWQDLGSLSDQPLAAIVRDNNIYGHSESGCFSQGIDINNTVSPDTAYSRVHDNDFHNSGSTVYSQAYLNTQEASVTGGDHDWGTGNTFASWTSVPSFTVNASIDPESMPLPSAGTVSYGEGSCTPPAFY